MRPSISEYWPSWKIVGGLRSLSQRIPSMDNGPKLSRSSSTRKTVSHDVQILSKTCPPFHLNYIFSTTKIRHSSILARSSSGQIAPRVKANLPALQHHLCCSWGVLGPIRILGLCSFVEDSSQLPLLLSDPFPKLFQVFRTGNSVRVFAGGAIHTLAENSGQCSLFPRKSSTWFELIIGGHFVVKV